MKMRITRIAANFVTAAILAACGSGGTAAPIISGPVISLNGSIVKNGSVYIAAGSTAVTLQATEANYGGSYTFTTGNSSIATVSIPAETGARHRDATSSVTNSQGQVIITAVSVGSTTLTVQTDSSVTVPLVVLNALVATPATLAFTAVGASASQTIALSEVGFTGTVTETDTCAGIATVTPTQLTAPSTATVTPVSGGSCTISFSDGKQTTTVPVGVTASGVIINAVSKP